jgi:hypothetical protein
MTFLELPGITSNILPKHSVDGNRDVEQTAMAVGLTRVGMTRKP